MLRSLDLHTWGDWLVFLTVLMIAILGVWWLVHAALAPAYRPPAIIAELTDWREIRNEVGDVSDVYYPCLDDSARYEMANGNGDEQYAAQHVKRGLLTLHLPDGVYCVRPGGFVPAWTLWLEKVPTLLAIIGAVAVVGWLARRFGYAG